MRAYRPAAGAAQSPGTASPGAQPGARAFAVTPCVSQLCGRATTATFISCGVSHGLHVRLTQGLHVLVATGLHEQIVPSPHYIHCDPTRTSSSLCHRTRTNISNPTSRRHSTDAGVHVSTDAGVHVSTDAGVHVRLLGLDLAILATHALEHRRRLRSE